MIENLQGPLGDIILFQRFEWSRIFKDHLVTLFYSKDLNDWESSRTTWWHYSIPKIWMIENLQGPLGDIILFQRFEWLRIFKDHLVTLFYSKDLNDWESSRTTWWHYSIPKIWIRESSRMVTLFYSKDLNDLFKDHLVTLFYSKDLNDLQGPLGDLFQRMIENLQGPLGDIILFQRFEWLRIFKDHLVTLFYSKDLNDRESSRTTWWHYSIPKIWMIENLQGPLGDIILFQRFEWSRIFKDHLVTLFYSKDLNDWESSRTTWWHYSIPKIWMIENLQGPLGDIILQRFEWSRIFKTIGDIILFQIFECLRIFKDHLVTLFYSKDLNDRESSRTTWWHYSIPKIWMILQGPLGDIILFQRFEWLRIFKDHLVTLFYSKDLNDWESSRTTWWHYSTPKIWMIENLQGPFGDIILFQIFECLRIFKDHLVTLFYSKDLNDRESSRTTWWHYSIPKIWMIENLQGPLGDIILLQRFEWSRIFKDHLVTLFYSKYLNVWESSRTTWWHYSIPKIWMIENLQGPLGDIILFQRFEWLRIFKDHLVTLFYSEYLNDWESSRTTWWHYSIPKIWMIENLQGPLGDIILFQRFEWSRIFKDHLVTLSIPKIWMIENLQGPLGDILFQRFEWLRIFKDHLVTLFYSKDLNDRESSRTTWWHYSIPKIWMIENLQGPFGDIILFQIFEWLRIFKDHLVTLFYSKYLNVWESSRTTWWHYSIPKIWMIENLQGPFGDIILFQRFEWSRIFKDHLVTLFYSKDLNDWESSRTTWWHYSIPNIWMIENLQGPLGDIILFQRFEWSRIFKDHLVTLFYSKDLNDRESSRTTWWHYSIPKIWMIENLQGPLGDILFQRFEWLRIFKDHLVTLFYSKDLNDRESSRTTWWHYSIPKIWMIENLQGPLGDIILLQRFEWSRIFKDHLVTLFYSKYLNDWESSRTTDIILFQRFEWSRIFKDHLVTLFYSKYLNVWESSRSTWWHYSIPKIWMIENLQGPLGDIILFQIFEWLRIFKDHLVTLFYSKDLNDRESSRTTWWHYSIPKIWMIENLQGPLGDIILLQRFEWSRIFKDHLVTLFYSKYLNVWESSRTTWWHYSIPKIWMIENLQGPLGDIILFQRFEWLRIFKDHLVTLFYSKYLNDWESSRTTWWHYSIPKIWMIENLQGPLGDIILFQRFEWSRIFKDHLVTLFYSKDLNDWESSRTTWWHSIPKIWMIENLQGPLGDIILFQRFEWLRIFKDHLVTLFYSKDLNDRESSRTTWWHYSIPKIWMIENLQGPLGDIILFQIFEWLRIFKDHLVTLFYSKDLNDWESSRTTWWHYSIPKIWMIENLQGPLGDIILFQRFEWLRIFKDHLVTLFYSKDLNDWESSRTTWWHYSIPKIWMIENLQGPLGDIILFQRFEWLRIFKDHLVTLFYQRFGWLQGPFGDILFQRFEWLRIFKDHLVTLFYSKDLNDRESSRTTWWHYSIPKIWMIENLQGPLGDIIPLQRFEWSRIFKDHLVTLFYSKYLNDWESSRTTWWHYSIPKIWMIENLQGPLGDIILFQRFEWLRIFKDHLVTLFYSKDLNDWESSRTTWWHYSIPKIWMIENLQGPLGDIILFQRFEWSRIFKDHLVTLFYSKDLNDRESSRTTWWHYSIPKIWMIENLHWWHSIPKIWMIENLQGPLGDIILFQRFEWSRIFKDHLVTLFYSKDLNDWESSRTTWWHYSIPKIWMIENLQGPLGDIILFQRFEWESSRTTWWHYSIPKIWMIENLQGPLGDIILFQRFEWSRIFKDHLVTLFYSKDLNDWESSRTTWWHYSIPIFEWLRIFKDHLVTLFYSKDLNDRESSRTTWWHYSIPKIWMIENLQGPLGDIIIPKIWMIENLQGPLGDIILFQRFEWLRIFKDHLVTLFYSKDLNDRESSRTTWWHYSIPKIWMIENLQGPLGDIILFQRFEWSRIFKDHLVTLFYSKDLNDWESSRTTWWHYSIPKIWMIENLQGPLGDIILFQRFEWSRIFKDHLVTLFYSKDLNDWESSRTTWWHYSTPKIWMIENLQGPSLVTFLENSNDPSRKLEWHVTNSWILDDLNDWESSRTTWWHYSIPKNDRESSRTTLNDLIQRFEWLNLQGPLGDIILFQRFEWSWEYFTKDHLVTLFYSKDLNDCHQFEFGIDSPNGPWRFSIIQIFENDLIQGPFGDIILFQIFECLRIFKDHLVTLFYSKDLNDSRIFKDHLD